MTWNVKCPECKAEIFISDNDEELVCINKNILIKRCPICDFLIKGVVRCPSGL